MNLENPIQVTRKTRFEKNGRTVRRKENMIPNKTSCFPVSLLGNLIFSMTIIGCKMLIMRNYRLSAIEKELKLE